MISGQNYKAGTMISGQNYKAGTMVPGQTYKAGTMVPGQYYVISLWSIFFNPILKARTICVNATTVFISS